MTSIEWLVEQCPRISTIASYELIEQAKELHKKEIIDAHLDGQSLVSCKDEYAEHYYSETFKKD